MPQVSSYLPSALALGAVMLAAVIITVMRPRLRIEERTSTRFLAVVGLTILAQGFHFLEELRTQFAVRFPETFGLPPLAGTVFVSFNVMWLAIWLVSLFAVRRGVVVAVLPLWFLGLGMVLNLVAHPVLAFRAGGYFPGLITAPLVGVLGIFVILELLRVTAPDIAGSRRTR